MTRHDKPRREPLRKGLGALRATSDITCIRCNETRPGEGAETFGQWGQVCAPCAKHLHTIDAKSTSRATP